jgi:hypothetical protein
MCGAQVKGMCRCGPVQHADTSVCLLSAGFRSLVQIFSEHIQRYGLNNVPEGLRVQSLTRALLTCVSLQPTQPHACYFVGRAIQLCVPATSCA